jgi:hypothetical protein
MLCKTNTYLNRTFCPSKDLRVPLTEETIQSLELKGRLTFLTLKFLPVQRNTGIKVLRATLILNFLTRRT